MSGTSTATFTVLKQAGMHEFLVYNIDFLKKSDEHHIF